MSSMKRRNALSTTLADDAQAQLFNDAHLPDGMRYQEDLVSVSEEQALSSFIAALPLKPFEFVGGLQGNRRVMSFGWRYDFNTHEIQTAEDMPLPLRDLREKAANFARLPPASFQQALVTEYAPGAGIGWHKDRSVFGEVIGISLLAPCNFRLRRKVSANKWERISLSAQPRSAYLLSGVSRTQWEHSIPPLDQLRYSVTFRNLRGKAVGAPPADSADAD
jgi:alkylated DNA repair dioxygenase AlkB